MFKQGHEQEVKRGLAMTYTQLDSFTMGTKLRMVAAGLSLSLSQVERCWGAIKFRCQSRKFILPCISAGGRPLPEINHPKTCLPYPIDTSPAKRQFQVVASFHNHNSNLHTSQLLHERKNLLRTVLPIKIILQMMT